MKSIIMFSVLVFCIVLFIRCNEKNNPVTPAKGTWTYCQGLPDNLNITGFAASGNNIVAGTFDLNQVYIFISFDNGTSWSMDTTFHVNNTSPVIHGYSSTPVTFLDYKGYLFAGNGGAYRGTMFRSTDHGITWSHKGIIWPETDSSMSENINCFATIDDNIFAGTDHGVFKSTNFGTNWVAVNSNLPLNPATNKSIQVLCMTVQGIALFVSTTYNQGIFLSSDYGLNWTGVNNGLTNAWMEITGLATINSKIFAGVYVHDFIGGVFATSDNGLNWNAINNGLTELTIDELASGGSYLFTSTNTNLFVSSNEGTIWNNISARTIIDSTVIGTISVINSQLFVGGFNGGAWRYPLAALPALIENNNNQQSQ